MEYIPASDYISLEGLTFATKPNQRGPRSFLCGDEPPTVTDGYAKWTVIDRPLLQGVTVPQGYNPAQLKLSLRAGVWDGRFGNNGWDTSETAGKFIETVLDDVHWMAGGNAPGGPGPVIYAEAFDASQPTRTRSHLIPKAYWGVPWVINGGVTWGKSLREPHGNRVYQEFELMLLGYTSAGGTNTSPPRETAGRAGGYFRTTSNVRTMLAIAGSSSSRTPEAFIDRLANMIKTSSRNNPIKGSRVHLERRSITWKIPLGLEVWVPGRSF